MTSTTYKDIDCRTVLDAVHSAVRRTKTNIEGKRSNQEHLEEEEGSLVLDDVPLDKDSWGGADATDATFVPRDDLDAAAAEALCALRSRGSEIKFDPSIVLRIIDDPPSAYECRVIARMICLLSLPKFSGRPLRQKQARIPTAALLLSMASNRSIPWQAREEALRCLSADRAPMPDLAADRFDFALLVSLVEGRDTAGGQDDASVRAAALDAVVSHDMTWSIPRLRAITEDRSRRPLPGWWDGDRRLQLARCALGDVSAFVTAVVRKYDPTKAQRREADDALRRAAHRLGGAVEVARRILDEDEVTDENGEVPELGGRGCDRRVWEFLADRHWNECIVRWAFGEAKKLEPRTEDVEKRGR